MDGEVLVLNQDFEPLNICNLRRASVLVYLGKAEVLHTDGHALTTVSGQTFKASVLRLRHQVHRPRPRLRLSRRSIFARDNYTCQYCGESGKEMTIDHVVPRRMGGGDTWENLVACCRRCNGKKGDKSLAQAGMRLLREPRKPAVIPLISLSYYLRGVRNQVWQQYLPDPPDVLGVH
ncbi:MAG: HNH endonuclease [Armatimonadota bacterium]|nr:HNH endonuclease [Armatimonadota bacterium]